MNNNKFLDLSGLGKYDALIKAYIASGDDVLRGELAAAIEALNAKIGELDGSDDKTLVETVEDIYASIAGIVEAQESLVAKDAEIEGKIAEEIGKIVGALADGETAMTLVEVAASLKSLGDRVTANEGDIAKLDSRVTTIEGTIEDLKNLGGENGLVAVVDKVNANMTAIQTLNGEGEGSVKKAAADAQAAAIEAAATDATTKADAAQAAAEQKATDLNAAMNERVEKLEAIDHDKLAADAAADAVAAVVAGAESDFDTLKDVADWIGSHKEGAAELQTTVSGHTESINAINGDIDALEAKVEKDIEDLSTHMTEAAAKIEEVDGRLAALDAFVEAHDRIPDADINSLFGITTEE